ncbi:hypothetical protein C0J52_24103 [Blattella germanica]|nr:hypothetical protein C0J52_24103 [Blattella germanica]
MKKDRSVAWHFILRMRWSSTQSTSEAVGIVRVSGVLDSSRHEDGHLMQLRHIGISLLSVFLVNRDVDGTAKSPMRALVWRIEISYKCSAREWNVDPPSRKSIYEWDRTSRDRGSLISRTGTHPKIRKWTCGKEDPHSIPSLSAMEQLRELALTEEQELFCVSSRYRLFFRQLQVSPEPLEHVLPPPGVSPCNWLVAHQLYFNQSSHLGLEIFLAKSE